MARKFPAPSTQSSTQQSSNDQPSTTTQPLLSIDIFNQRIQQTKLLHSKPQDLTWEHLQEDRFKLLGGTPLYRSQAESAADYIHAWAIIGTAACALGFDHTNNKAKQAHNTFVPSELRSLATPLTECAGPFFEQTHLATLKALDSHTCFSATLPGPNFSMQKHVVLQPEEKFLRYKENPFLQNSILLPAGVHAHGRTNKELLRHFQFDMWTPLEITLSGIGRATPFLLQKQGQH